MYCKTRWTGTNQDRQDSNCYQLEAVPLTWAVQFLTLPSLTAEAYRVLFTRAAFSFR